jgi:hypothetical protein
MACCPFAFLPFSLLHACLPGNRQGTAASLQKKKMTAAQFSQPMDRYMASAGAAVSTCTSRKTGGMDRVNKTMFLLICNFLVICK